ncbi:MAG: helix-turn-helix domain-containing protein, partial [Actinobacteria bacterium]|nr:helix-turn-helix domain-containing protein [Actinomycetota bacterium]NIX20344.1 helix-turn-helix domain-containing protein [Actinomycetota bacterium]
FPEAVSVEVREIGAVSGPNPAARLSDRQREAVEAGLELGYYEVPRAATHRDVADRLGCSPSTASEHLQKAEAKLVRAA